MTKEKRRANRELKKPKTIKAPAAAPDAPFGKAVSDRIAAPKKKTP